MATPSGRTVIGIASLTLGFALERFAYYGVRSLLMLMMIQTFRMEMSHASTIVGVFTAGTYLTFFLGAGVAALAGPRLTMLGGALFSIFGLALLIPVNEALLYPALGLIALGTSLVRVSLFAVAGTLIPRGNDSMAMGVAALLYVAVNVGAFMAPLIVGTVGQGALGYGGGMAAATGGELLSIVALVGAVAASGVREPFEFRRARGLVGGALLALAVVPIYVLMEGTMSMQDELSRRTDLGNWFLSINPAVVIATGVVFAVVFLVLGASKIQLRPGWVFGIGAILFALSVVPTLTASATGPVLGRVILSAVLGGIGELVFSAAAIGRLATCSSPRLVPITIALFYMSSFFGNYLSGFLGPSPGYAPAMWGASGVTLIVGIAAIGLAGVFHRVFFADPEPKPSAPPQPASI